jgi:hypothetical protein
MKARGDKPTEIVSLLQEAALRNPRNAQALFLLAPLLAGQEQQEAYRCVCAIQPTSRECRLSQQALE